VIREMVTRFYSHMFKDALLHVFIFEVDGPEHHGKRFADFVIESLGGEGKPWSESGRYGMVIPVHH
jgi:truncated hemoglobin YjbI